MTDKAARHASQVRGPGVTALEASVGRTQQLLADFREELVELVAEVQRDVDRLREAALGNSSPRPTAGRERDDDVCADLRLAETLGMEQATDRIREITNAIVNQRFEGLDRLIKARLAETNALRNLVPGPSRRRF